MALMRTKMVTITGLSTIAGLCVAILLGACDSTPKFNNATYSGPVVGGKAEGFGTMTFTDGRKYVGEFRNNNFNGHDKFTTPKGDELEGQFRDGAMNGQGAWRGAEGITYVGDFVAGAPSGAGTYNYKSGERYEGQVLAWQHNGFGTHTWPSGQKFVGNWRVGKYDGQGTLTRSDGQIQTGLWRDGQYVGSAAPTTAATPVQYRNQSQPMRRPSYQTDPTQSRILRIYNLSSGGECRRMAFEGRVAQRNFSGVGTIPSSIALQGDDGERALIIIDTSRVTLDYMPMVDIRWITHGLQTLLNEGRQVVIGVDVCGAAGRVVILDSIMSSVDAPIVMPSAGAQPPAFEACRRFPNLC